jgi:hypothetical protein
MSRCCLPIAAAILAGGCQSNLGYEPIKVAEPKPVAMEGVTGEGLLGLEPGKKWTYVTETIVQGKDQTRREKSVIEIIAAKEVSSSNGKEVTLEFTRDGKLIDSQTWQVRANGAYQLSTGVKSVPFSSALPIVPLPLVPNKVVSWSGTGQTVIEQAGMMNSQIRVRGVETVDTVSGKRSGIAVETKTTFQAGKLKGSSTFTTWFQPGVGIIRLRQAVSVPSGSITSTLSLYRES